VTTSSAQRDLDLGLARLHLRTGMLGLARAELEALAGAGGLDPVGLADLAEARWRTNDLAGAGEAAQAHLAAGGAAPVALVIAAEATAAAGRAGDARELAGRAIEALDGRLETVFAGISRSPIWPAEARAEVLAHDEPPSAPAAEEPAGGVVEASAAHRALEAGRAALEAGDVTTAALQLAVALRFSPLLAATILELASSGGSPALALVRGDALNALGHESEAQRAWMEAVAPSRE
jgi:hypothetical protein